MYVQAQTYQANPNHTCYIVTQNVWNLHFIVLPLYIMMGAVYGYDFSF